MTDDELYYKTQNAIAEIEYSIRRMSGILHPDEYIGQHRSSAAAYHARRIEKICKHYEPNKNK